MPLISELHKTEQKSKLFQKKPYRPWDSELLTTDNHVIIKDDDKEDLVSTNRTITTQLIQDKTYNKRSDINGTSILSAVNDHSINLEKELRNLYGAQKIVIQYLLEQIEENNNEYLITKNISMNEFISTCNLPSNTIKGMLQKLKLKGLITTYENKPGRGGYARYKFMQEIYAFFSKNLHISKNSNKDQ